MGSSRDLDRVNPIVDRVRAHPLMRLEHDWVTPVSEAIRSGRTDADLTPGDARRHAREDLGAVLNADVRWLLAPPPHAPSRGAWVELGAALASGGHVIVSGPHASASIFTRMATMFGADDTAWSEVCRLARGGVS
jgi:hypothetical protein